MLEQEKKYAVTADYMIHQPKITPKFREVLVDWLSSVRGKYSLKPETFALAINLLDRYLEKRQIEKNLLQLLGCTCLWVASKYEEIYPPELQDLVLICESNFKRETFILMEKNILTLLDFRISVPYAHHFAERYIQSLPAQSFDRPTLVSLTNYLIESTHQHYSFVGKLPSAVGAAALSLALILTQQTHWNRNLEIASGYTYDSLRSLVVVLWQHISDVHDQHFAKREVQTQQDQIRRSYINTHGVEPPADQLPRIPKAFDSVLRLHSTDALGNAPTWMAKFDPELVPAADSLDIQ